MAKNFVLPSLGLSLVAALGLASCESAQIDLPVDPLLLPQQERGPDYGLDHDDILDNVGDIFKDGRQLTPAEGEKLHSCGKLRFDTFARILKSRGLNLDNNANGSVGALLKRAQPVWGVANFFARVPEATRNSTSSLVSLEDVMIAMAEELITPTNSEGVWMSGDCQGAKLFDGKTCNRDGLACLVGATPSDRQIDLCNNMTSDTTAGVADELTRKRLAVAAIAGVAFLCD